ncbi:MAG: LysR substrate-binding domain-containing protein, partial [Candidatus Binatia bacterium]
WEPYHKEEVVVIAPPTHPLTKKGVVPLELLAEELFVMNNKESVIRDMVERTFAERGLSLKIALEINIRFGGRSAIRNAVANGLGIAFVTHCHAKADIEVGRLKILKVADLNLKRTLYTTMHKTRRRSPLVQMFRDFLSHLKEGEMQF